MTKFSMSFKRAFQIIDALVSFADLDRFIDGELQKNIDPEELLILCLDDELINEILMMLAKKIKTTRLVLKVPESRPSTCQEWVNHMKKQGRLEKNSQFDLLKTSCEFETQIDDSEVVIFPISREMEFRNLDQIFEIFEDMGFQPANLISLLSVSEQLPPGRFFCAEKGRFESQNNSLSPFCAALEKNIATQPVILAVTDQKTFDWQSNSGPEFNFGLVNIQGIALVKKKP